jgi:hypothetical protein
MESKNHGTSRIEIRVSLLSESDLGALLTKTSNLYGPLASGRVLVELANLELWFQQIRKADTFGKNNNIGVHGSLLRLRCQVKASSLLFDFLTEASETTVSGQRGLQICKLASEALSRTTGTQNRQSLHLDRSQIIENSLSDFGNKAAIRKSGFLDD